MNDGIEKLQKYAFGMKPRRCDDILVLADQIQREHVSELKALEERYHTDLQNAREARDIAIKEAAELRDHGIDNSSNADAEARAAKRDGGVDVAALLELADMLECRIDYARTSPIDSNSIGVVDGIGDTPERINDDARLHVNIYCAKYDLGTSDPIGKMVRHLLDRQRELNARTMGGDA